MESVTPWHNLETRRALELDALSAILPVDRRDRLAELLTDGNVETLKHLAREGMGENTLRALASDFAYLEAWALAVTGLPLPWPATEALLLKFVAHHLWDPVRRETDARHGMPAEAAERLRQDGFLRSDGPHAPGTVRRRLSSWSTLHRWRGVEGAFASPALRSALRLAVRASDRPRGRKSRRAVTRDIFDRLAATCGSDRLVDTRDLAILMVAFASGGRRRSEVARLRLEQLQHEPPVLADPADPGSSPSALSVAAARPDQDRERRRRQPGLAGRPAGDGAAILDRARQYQQGAGVPGDRPLGRAQGQGSDAAVSEPGPEAPLLRGRPRSAGILGARAALGLPHRGRPPGRAPARGDAAVSAPLRPAGRQLLQRGGSDPG